MKIEVTDLLKIQARVGIIQNLAQDRTAITDECKEISEIIRKAIYDASIQR